MDQLEQLKAKYNSVLEFIKQSGVHLTHLHVQDNKLFIQGTAPSEQIKNEAWNRVKAVDSTYRDLTCDLTVDSSFTSTSSGAGRGRVGECIHEWSYIHGTAG